MDKAIYLLLKVGVIVIKFFVTLYLTFFGGLIISIIAVLALLGGITESVKTPELTERTFAGTFSLLNQSVEGLNQAQLNAKVTEYKKHFPSLFELLELESIQPTAEEYALFKHSKIVSRVDETEEKLKLADDEDSVTLHYYQLPEPFQTKMWQTNSDFDVTINQWMKITITGNQMVKGMFYLAEQGFYNKPESEWQHHLRKLQQLQQFPVRLVKLDDAKISASDLKDIKQGDIVNITQGLRLVSFAHRIDHSPYILIFEVAEVPLLLYNMLYILILAIALVIAIPVFLWVWPLWRNLSQLQSAAESFGAGEYATRVPQSKYSRLASLSSAFNAMAERTQRSIDSHKELTSAVSHELRTPVARMRFSLEMLSANDNQQDKKRYIEDINTDIEELDLLLGELLTYARFDRDSGNMTFQSQNITTWLSDSMERLQPLANKMQLDYKIENISTKEMATFEPRLMSRVLDNLVQNALRYANTTVRVSLSKDHQNYILSVEDDGIGIAEDEREKLFDAFSRIDSSRDRSSGGFGLGLAIAKRIVKGHQGTISVDDSDLGGAGFMVRWLVL